VSAVRLSRRAFLCGRPPAPLFTTVQPEEPAPAIEGPQLARIDLRACLSSATQVCTVCVERCGARGAIVLRGMLPFVRPERCTGCGACAADCPAPASAIRMVPSQAGVR
jgi:MinD superfamily P-loop ATPase